MKTKNVFFSAVLIATMAFSTAFASEGKTKSTSTARQELINDINKVVSTIPFDDFIGHEDCCRVAITFKLNEESELTDFVVTSENTALSRYLQIKLDREHLTADPMLHSGNYRIKVKYENNSVL